MDPSLPSPVPTSLGALARMLVAEAGMVCVRVEGFPSRDTLLRRVDAQGRPVVDVTGGVATEDLLGRGATIYVTDHRAAPVRVTVHVTGVLVPDASPSSAVLEVASVVLEYVESGQPVISRRLEAGEYSTAAMPTPGLPDVDHVNVAHGAQLRRLAAECAGRPVSAVAAAWVTRLDGQGIDLRWVDADGAHVRRLDFPVGAASGS
ncbi:hypothetical protein OO014_16120 [Intrasporangium calvum]|uniref:Uncharacterized protein n=1 Tax=Intrasporangium calvum TaxID=53358 RepID=A0ABT5GKR3_9MICO|nr:hypothetical protein [Intrasporangium calvum]